MSGNPDNHENELVIFSYLCSGGQNSYMPGQIDDQHEIKVEVNPQNPPKTVSTSGRHAQMGAALGEICGISWDWTRKDADRTRVGQDRLGAYVQTCSVARAFGCGQADRTRG